MVIEVEGLSKAFGDRLLIDDLSFKLPPGGIVGVIGPNGAGKTTLFKMLTGQEKPDKGAIKFGSTVKLSYVDQSRAHLDEELRRGARAPPNCTTPVPKSTFPDLTALLEALEAARPEAVPGAPDQRASCTHGEARAQRRPTSPAPGAEHTAPGPRS